MNVAQRLYEAGYITYMRTDSVNLSEEAKNNIKNQIKLSFGDKYLKQRHFKTKIKVLRRPTKQFVQQISQKIN